MRPPGPRAPTCSRARPCVGGATAGAHRGHVGPSSSHPQMRIAVPASQGLHAVHAVPDPSCCHDVGPPCARLSPAAAESTRATFTTRWPASCLGSLARGPARPATAAAAPPRAAQRARRTRRLCPPPGRRCPTRREAAATRGAAAWFLRCRPGRRLRSSHSRQCSSRAPREQEQLRQKLHLPRVGPAPVQRRPLQQRPHRTGKQRREQHNQEQRSSRRRRRSRGTAPALLPRRSWLRSRAATGRCCSASSSWTASWPWRTPRQACPGGGRAFRCAPDPRMTQATRPPLFAGIGLAVEAARTIPAASAAAAAFCLLHVCPLCCSAL